MHRNSLFCLLFALIITGANAQNRPDPLTPQGENLKVPEGWEFRLDRADDSVKFIDEADKAGLFFVNMTPGWHLTTGPRGIFYHPANTVMGEYSIHTKLYLFNPNGRNREGYGLFFAGKDLQKPEQEYIYFLIRNTGDFLVKARKGEELEVIIDWTASDAIVLYDNEEVSSVANELMVKVGRDTLSFFINSEEVAAVPKQDFSTEGIFGLRVNHSVNLHIEDLGTGLD
jgi:hypothetical protein